MTIKQIEARFNRTHSYWTGEEDPNFNQWLLNELSIADTVIENAYDAICKNQPNLCERIIVNAIKLKELQQ